MDELDLALKKIDEMVQRQEHEILTGSPADYAEYRYLCGGREGMLRVRREIVDVRGQDDDEV